MKRLKGDRRGEVYFMVDIESDGPIPGPYSMNSFGAVALGMRRGGTIEYFNVDDKNLQFYAELKPISEDFVPEAIAVGGFDHEQLKITGREPVEAMSEFAEWLTKTTKAVGGNRPVFVGYPLGFDWMFTYWYLVKFAKTGSPFGHSTHIDAKTLYAEKANVGILQSAKRLMPSHLFSKRPHTHNALDDAIEQALWFQNLLKWDGS